MSEDSFAPNLNVSLTPQSILGSTKDSSLERGINWLKHESLLLLEGKKRLGEEMQFGPLMKALKSRAKRWEFVSSFLADMGVKKTALQCEYRWSRLWKPFKTIFDYEKTVPSGQDSYWHMGGADRMAKKLPRSFDPKIFSAMKDKFGGDHVVDPGDILVDTASHRLPGKLLLPAIDTVKDPEGSRPESLTNADRDSDVIEIPMVEVKENSSGKKRKRPGRPSSVKKEFEDTTKQLLNFFGDIEKDRIQNQRDLMEIRRHEFESTLQLQKERIAAAQLSSNALMEIAGAIKLLTSAKGPQA